MALLTEYSEAAMTQVDLTLPVIDTTLRDTRPLARSRSAYYFGMAIAMSVTVFSGSDQAPM